MAIWRDIERVRGTLVRETHRYWDGKRNGRVMPARADIDPSEIKHLLANLIIVHITAEPFRVRYRLLGTKVVATSGLDFTGRHLDELMAADLENSWTDWYRMVCADKRPVFGDATVPTADGGSFRYEFGIFPLGSDGATVTQCMAVEDYGPLNDRLFELQHKAQPWHLKPIRTKEPDGQF